MHTRCLTTVDRYKSAVSVRRSVRPDHLVRLICGKPDYPMAATNYAQRRRELASVPCPRGSRRKLRYGRPWFVLLC